MSKTSRTYHRLFSVFGLSMLAVLAGCAAIPGETRIPFDRQIVSRHHCYSTPKSPELDSSRVLGVAKVNPKWWIENADEPLPWWWKPEAPLDERTRTWALRNPFHNFTSYIIGVSDRHTHRIGINAHSIWNDEGPFNATVTRAGPLIYLPMISNRGPLLEWYIGWRTSGSFGIALRLAQHDSDGTGPRGRSPLAKAKAAREAAEKAAQSQAHSWPAEATVPEGPMPPPQVEATIVPATPNAGW
ncbi:MAG: hypothetical protein H8E44_14785 [Planctomycetes bacterium]|nr:hypothetical protein [Planctomycetota bacterium]